ncbi:MAG: winged helix-turn-helix transcriptional regulator [Elusimicrobia bacterium]|nr:winged helix-turn-helix transcriptional regulator [Elusimicrobiota bacterium]
MIYLKGHLARPLDAVLSAASRLAVLRALARAKTPLSGRRLARLAGINHQGAASALAALEKLGLVERRPAGRSDQWRLDRGRWLMSELLLPLFEREAEHADAVAGAIKKGLRGKAAAVLIAGAAARGSLEPERPVELVIVEGAAGRRTLSEAVRGLTALLRERWSLGLEARVLTRREAVRAAALEDLWELLPAEGPPSYFAAGTTVQR